jgi:FkbM family methyltransferase
MMSFMTVSSAVETRLARLVERNPYLWKASWELVKRLPFLLPHDKSYNAFRHFIKAVPRGLFLDIGANDGISALGFRKFSVDYRILSLEPNLLLEPPLKKLRDSDALFDYKMVGVGSSASTVRFFTPVYGRIPLHTFTSANLENVRNGLRQALGSRAAEKATIREFSAEITTVDALGVDPSIVKIDAEGFDYDVLLGAAGTIRRTRPFITVEVAWSRRDLIQEFFAQSNYILLSYDVMRDQFSPPVPVALAQGDRNLFAVPKERLLSIPVSHEVGRATQQGL